MCMFLMNQPCTTLLSLIFFAAPPRPAPEFRDRGRMFSRIPSRSSPWLHGRVPLTTPEKWMLLSFGMLWAGGRRGRKGFTTKGGAFKVQQDPDKSNGHRGAVLPPGHGKEQGGNRLERKTLKKREGVKSTSDAYLEALTRRRPSRVQAIQKFTPGSIDQAKVKSS